MQAEELVALVEEIRQQRSECQNVELKEAGKGFPHRIYDTLSSFSNQDMGGVIIFGVGDKPTYNVVGVYDLEDAQKKSWKRVTKWNRRCVLCSRLGRLTEKSFWQLRFRG